MAKILICDDNENWHRVARDACNSLNQRCKTVMTYQEALREITTSSYPLVMLDMQNLFEEGGIAKGWTYDYADDIKEIQPGVFVLGVSNWSSSHFETEADRHFDEIIEKEDLIRNDEGNFPGWEKIFQKYL